MALSPRCESPTACFPNTQPHNTGIGSFFSGCATAAPLLIHGEDDVLQLLRSMLQPVTRGASRWLHNQRKRDHNPPTGLHQLSKLRTRKKRLLVQWHDGGQNLAVPETDIRCTGQMGILADLGAACKTQGINITRMEAQSIVDEEAIITLEISIQHVSQIAILKKNIQKINGVLSVTRNSTLF